MQRVFMVGWDGATFDLIRPWVAEGKLPTISRLMDEGVHGELESTMPPWTFPAWTSFMTGMNPGKHGIFDFFGPREGSYDLEFVNGGHRRAATFWRLLSDAGRKVVSISLPCTFPPEKVNGVMISGFDFPGEGPGSFVDSRGMYPPQLFDELNSKVGPHPIDASISKEVNRGEFDVVIERILETIRAKAATAKYLMKEHDWDCFMILFGESDGTGHQFWKFTDPNSPLYTEHPDQLGDSLLRVYQELDRQLAEMVEKLPDDVTLMMMSDHGFGGVSDWCLYPNCWLHEQGWLTLHERRTRWTDRLLNALKLWAVQSLPAWMQRSIYRHASWLVGRIEARSRFGSIDWSGTRAYFDETPYFPMLRINLQGRQPEGIVAPADYESVREEVIEMLESWVHPQTGQPIVEKVFRREDVYSGPCVENAPDVIPKWALHDGYSYAFRKCASSPDLRWIDQVDPRTPENQQFYASKSGTHRDHGIFLASGPGIRSGGTVADARIIDLAPTILALLDVPIPANMDGCVLEEIFANEDVPDRIYQTASALTEESSLAYSLDDQTKVSDRLRALGYIE